MKSLLIFGGLVTFLWVRPASALPEFLRAVPNGDVNRCSTCHEKSGPPDLNPFGNAFLDEGLTWSPSLAHADADKDGVSNGKELGDPDGTWHAGAPPPPLTTTISLPGDPASRPVTLSRWAVMIAPFTLLLGHFHPVLVHLPIGGLLLVGFLEVLALFPGFDGVARNCRLILLLTLAGAVGAVVCGWVLSHTGSYETDLLRWHKWTGFSVAGACLSAVVFDWLRKRRAYQVALWAGIILLVVASHFGGSLTHGRDFLTLKFPARPSPQIELQAARK